MPQYRTTSFSPAIATHFARFAACAVLLLAAAPAGAASLKRLELLNQSVRLEGQSATVGLGLRAHLAGGDLNEGFVLMPVIEYWREKDRIENVAVVELMQRDWRFGADVRYNFGSGTGWTPYVGGGFALHSVRSSSYAAFPGFAPLATEDGNTLFSPNLLGGVDLPLTGRIRNSFEIAYDMVPD